MCISIYLAMQDLTVRVEGMGNQLLELNTNIAQSHKKIDELHERIRSLRYSTEQYLENQ